MSACRSGSPSGQGPNSASDKGSLSGTVRGPQGADPAADRLVEAVEVKTGRRYSTVTNVVGGFTLLLRPGTYRLTVTLARGEAVVTQPEPVAITADATVTGIDFVLGGAGVIPP
jgi:Carboxypeptidase regulatory-like domain